MSKIYVGKSSIHGKGVFARRTLKRGEIIFILKGKLRRFVIMSRKDALSNANWIGIGQHLWMEVRPGSPGDLINHSCDPNAGVRGRVTIVALKRIDEEQEIVIDYSIIEKEPFWHMPCRCRRSKCRGVVRAIEFLPESVYKSYLPFVPHYFQRIYDAKRRYAKLLE